MEPLPLFAEADTDCNGGKVSNGMEVEAIGGGTLAAMNTEQAGAMTYAAREIEVGMLAAKRFPRDIARVEQRLAHICKRPRLAEKAEYLYQRGGTAIGGPTIVLLRAIAGEYGNMQSGFVVTDEDADGGTLNAFAWDYESNYRAARSIRLLRKVQRKINGITQWVTPDERDWREYVGNIGSRMERRCMENVIPGDIVDYARELCAETRKREDAKDPDAARRRILRAFDALAIPVSELEAYMEKPTGKFTADDWDKLQKIGIGIKEGQAKWADYQKMDDNKATVGADMLAGLKDTKLISAKQIDELKKLATNGDAAEALQEFLDSNQFKGFADIPASMFEKAKAACK